MVQGVSRRSSGGSGVGCERKWHLEGVCGV